MVFLRVLTWIVLLVGSQHVHGIANRQDSTKEDSASAVEKFNMQTYGMCDEECRRIELDRRIDMQSRNMKEAIDSDCDARRAATLNMFFSYCLYGSKGYHSSVSCLASSALADWAAVDNEFNMMAMNSSTQRLRDLVSNAPWVENDVEALSALRNEFLVHLENRKNRTDSLRQFKINVKNIIARAHDPLMALYSKSRNVCEGYANFDFADLFSGVNFLKSRGLPASYNVKSNENETTVYPPIYGHLYKHLQSMSGRNDEANMNGGGRQMNVDSSHSDSSKSLHKDVSSLEKVFSSIKDVAPVIMNHLSANNQSSLPELSFVDVQRLNASSAELNNQSYPSDLPPRSPSDAPLSVPLIRSDINNQNLESGSPALNSQRSEGNPPIFNNHRPEYDLSHADRIMFDKIVMVNKVIQLDHLIHRINVITNLFCYDIAYFSEKFEVDL